MEHDKPLATYLRMHRLETGFSHGDVAFLLGAMYGSNVCAHERGRRIPGLRTILAYEIILGVPARDLYEGVFHEVRAQVLERARGLSTHLKRKTTATHRNQKIARLRSMLEELQLA